MSLKEITKQNLKKAKFEDVLRLAKWFRLNISFMSNDQIINLVYWRASRKEYR